MVKAGLTGGIASGKSAAAKFFEEAGATIVDADVLSRRCLLLPEVRAALREAFPSAFCGDELDRAKLRELVFEDASKLQRLNGITHPPIRRAAEKALQESRAPVTILVAPLLFEAGLDDLVHPIVTVACEASLRIARLMKRDTISEALAKRMIDAQLSDSDRAKRADVVLGNDGDLAQLRKEVLRLCEEWTA